MKAKLSFLFFFLIVLSIVFSQNTTTKKVEDRVERVGGTVWFIKNIQMDSLLCAGNVTGLCQLKTSFTQEVEVVQADPSLPFDKIKEAHSGGYGVVLSQLQKPFPDNQVSWTGFSYEYPIFRDLIKYNKESHRIESFTDTISGTNYNASSFLIFLILCVYTIYCCFTLYGVWDEEKFKTMLWFLWAITPFLIYCLFFISSDKFLLVSNNTDAEAGFINTYNFIIGVLGAVVFLVLGFLFGGVVYSWFYNKVNQQIHKLFFLPPFILGFGVFALQSNVWCASKMVGILIVTVLVTYCLQELVKITGELYQQNKANNQKKRNA